VERAVAAVPDEFLVPLLGQEASPDALRERRMAYVDFLERRVMAPRPFLAPIVLPNEQRRRGRPDWLARRP